MKKIMINSIKIMLITILIYAVFYPISTASNMSYLAEIYISVEDEEGNKISNVKLEERDIREGQTDDSVEEFETDGTNKLWTRSSYKIYPYTYDRNNLEQVFEFNFTEVPNGYILPTGKLQFCFTRDQNDKVTIKTISNNDNIQFEYTTGNLHDDIWIPVNIVFKIKKQEQTPTPITLDCGVKVENISGIGNTVQVVSNSTSEHASIEVSNIVQYLSTQNITIQQVKDISGNTIDLNSTTLIGTGTSLIAEDGTNYTIIIYGDATGDGEVNAADISVIINDFLETNTNISQINNIAGDVYKDEKLNAADISLMINSFLGTLKGDILQTNNTK